MTIPGSYEEMLAMEGRISIFLEDHEIEWCEYVGARWFESHKEWLSKQDKWRDENTQEGWVLGALGEAAVAIHFDLYEKWKTNIVLDRPDFGYDLDTPVGKLQIKARWRLGAPLLIKPYELEQQPPKAADRFVQTYVVGDTNEVVLAGHIHRRYIEDRGTFGCPGKVKGKPLPDAWMVPELALRRFRL